MAKKKVVVIGHGYTSRLAVIRSVAQIGCEITVIVVLEKHRLNNKNNKKKPIDCYSKYVNRYLFYEEGDDDSLVKLLLSECVDPLQKVVLFPDSDFSASVIDRNQNQLKEHFLFPHVQYTQGAIVEWMNKTRQKILAEKNGLKTASSSVVIIANHEYQLPQGIKYPCFVKPLVSIIGGKRVLRRCNNEEELRECLNFAADISDMDVLIEDYKVIDDEYAILGFSDGTEVIIPGIIKILELSHGGHFGVASKGMIMPIAGFEDLVKKFTDLVLQIGFVGVFDIDFFHSDGDFYFGELNLRIGGSCYSLTKMGVNLPGMMVKNLCGETIDGMKKEIHSAATFVNERMLLDDWNSRYISTNKFNDIIKTADISFVKDKNDKLPFRYFYREYLIKKMKRFFPVSLRRYIKKTIKKV